MTFHDLEHKNSAIENLKLGKKILINLDVPFFLSNGTLLGCVRDNDLIEHDQDTDIGINSKYLREYGQDIFKAFLANGFEVYSVYGKLENGLQYSFKRNGVKYDIFFYYDEDDKTTMSVWKNNAQYKYVFPKITEIIKVPFLDDNYPIPKNYETYLSSQYGDWKTPVINWDCYRSPKNIEVQEELFKKRNDI